MDASKLPLGSFIGTILLLSILYKLVKLIYYVGQARKTGLPYTIVPILETEFLAKLLTPLIRPLFTRRLSRGEGWPRWMRFSILDWAWEEKRRVHEELGDVFIVVSPEGLVCYSADADMSWDVMNRRNEFLKPRDKYKVLEPYGPNVATTEGKAYNFHVRITAPPFNDGSGANDLVWNEASDQARALMESWSQENTTRDLSLDINRLTLAVIAYTGFGKRLDFKAEVSDLRNKIPPGYKMSLHNALHLVTTFMVKILLIPKWIMRMTSMKEIAVAHGELEKYMREMIRTETANLSKDSEYQSADAKGNLLTSVLRASAFEAKAAGRKQAFSEDEVLGNLFLYLLAGYETTANAMTYGFITLALRQDLQDKIIKEVDGIYAEAAAEGRTSLNYTDDFGKFQYTYGFMYEVFRLYPGVCIITKMVPKDTTITVYPENKSPRQHVLPAECRVYLNVNAVHYHERYWPDPWALKPDRWMGTIGATPNERPDKKVVASDKSRQVRGTLMTFSGGARACLGRKFTQSEYISVLATVLREYRIVLGEGMDAKVVKQEIDHLAAGTVTLAPLKYVKLALKKRTDVKTG
ncbi:cytochrome P450 [Dendryphion nanum]|uniref:Cytochrome P450 n=1 Tax=Dendryphion nanum TaxID=256645 RepID=A0A9P9D6Z4_9PLEO|nr:cytochrome P450 [Dendryphion nanum]